jgi:hypothetical protein
MSRPLMSFIFGFLILLGAMTIIVIVRNGFDPLTIVSLLFVAFLLIGLIGAMRSYNR